MRPLEPPPVRRLFVPDLGYTLFEVDLKRADAQIVARESGDEPLLQDFRDNRDIYTENAAWLYNIPMEKVTTAQYQKNKAAVHAINYYCKARTIAKTLGVSTASAEEFMEDWWFKKHPGIRQWHKDISKQLQKTRTVRNVYGFRKYYTDRLDNLLSQALAWIASSTVSITINTAMVNVYRHLPSVQILLQIHDSILGQVRTEDVDKLFPAILEECSIEIPYEPPLTIPETIKASEASWGDVTTW